MIAAKYEEAAQMVMDNLCQVAEANITPANITPVMWNTDTGSAVAVLTVPGLQIEVWCGDGCGPYVWLRIGPTIEDSKLINGEFTCRVSEQKAAEILAIWMRKDDS